MTTLLAYSEQGQGDAIQFARYLPLAAQRCDRLIVQCQPSLKRLISRIEGVSEVVTHGEAPEHDKHIAFMSFPYVFGTTLETVPKPADFRIPRWPASADRPLHVGLVWSGQPGLSLDIDRSAPVNAFAPLLDVSSVAFAGLQKGPRWGEYQTLTALEDRDDWLDTAEVIASLDLVISVDTAVAHLAGSLGVETWLLLPTHPEWRWPRGSDTTPWYPTHRLYRRKHTRDWPGVIARVKADLERRVKG